MVILNIPKKKANVNVFQMRINILLIFNNFNFIFLVIMTQHIFSGLIKTYVKLLSITNLRNLDACTQTKLNVSYPLQSSIYIKGIVNLIIFRLILILQKNITLLCKVYLLYTEADFYFFTLSCSNSDIVS